MATNARKRNPQDATLRNVRALQKRVDTQRDQIRELRRRVTSLERARRK